MRKSSQTKKGRLHGKETSKGVNNEREDVVNLSDIADLWFGIHQNELPNSNLPTTSLSATTTTTTTTNDTRTQGMAEIETLTTTRARAKEKMDSANADKLNKMNEYIDPFVTPLQTTTSCKTSLQTLDSDSDNDDDDDDDNADANANDNDNDDKITQQASLWKENANKDDVHDNAFYINDIDRLVDATINRHEQDAEWSAHNGLHMTTNVTNERSKKGVPPYAVTNVRQSTRDSMSRAMAPVNQVCKSTFLNNALVHMSENENGEEEEEEEDGTLQHIAEKILDENTDILPTHHNSTYQSRPVLPTSYVSCAPYTLQAGQLNTFKKSHAIDDNSRFWPTPTTDHWADVFLLRKATENLPNDCESLITQFLWVSTLKEKISSKNWRSLFFCLFVLNCPHICCGNACFVIIQLLCAIAKNREKILFYVGILYLIH
ncbi:hypothetical protein RFI_06451 [Reticulomyxa filosa]|uniref:Uncharacterized protein n=1 Tax=Reticulomyxa filosa TaxID=46433 RepID=X6NXW6_RETFI|nr:hypothetical protein RFI_06451 [Reticulomyxa filosa]|eukprot:ETO30669.1 hypothetical protein RFI_06451 [Reticulomyxa filosa]